MKLGVCSYPEHWPDDLSIRQDLIHEPTHGVF